MSIFLFFCDLCHLYQINKYLLQIARIFLRSQPTPRPSPSQEGNSVGPSHTGIASIPFFRSEIILFSWCATRCDWRRRGVAPLSWSIGYGEETRSYRPAPKIAIPPYGKLRRSTALSKDISCICLFIPLTIRNILF